MQRIWPCRGAAKILPAISPLRRQALLAQTLLQTGYSASAIEAAAMAKALASFLDQMQDEELAFTALDGLVPEIYAAHWQQTLKLLHIVRDIWPQLLAIEGALDPAVRRDRLFTAQIAAWQADPPPSRVIVAGSTGSLKGVRRLMRAVLALPQGEVVLPALDRDLDEESWQALDTSHPQYYLRQLLADLQAERQGVPDWAGLDPCQTAARQYLITELFRPAATTEQWQKLQPVQVTAGCEGHYQAGLRHRARGGGGDCLPAAGNTGDPWPPRGARYPGSDPGPAGARGAGAVGDRDR